MRWNARALTDPGGPAYSSSCGLLNLESLLVHIAGVFLAPFGLARVWFFVYDNEPAARRATGLRGRTVPG